VAVFEAVEFATLEWVDWFNNRRLLEPIGNIPPAEAEERYYAMLWENQPWPRDSNQTASGKPGAVQLRDRKTPRLSRRRESFAKKPSTALSQDADVGVKWKVHRGWRASHLRTFGCLWVP
jgi:hypothetical protein